MSFKKIYQEKKESFELSLSKLFEQIEGIPEPLAGAIRHGLLGGGKRLRPILLLESFRVFCGEPTETAVKFACAAECIHSYSLIHDDLPCMDNDDFRRGKPTVHKEFGEGIAVLAGDALLNLAYELMSESVMAEPENKNIIKAMNMLAVYSGSRGLIAGQTADITVNDDLTSDKLQYIYRHKTGDLMIASAVAGALLGGANQEELENMRNFATQFAYAFQVKDDILDYAEKPDKEGVSFVKFYGRTRSAQTLGDMSQKARKELSLLQGRNTEFLEQLTINFAARKE